MISQARVKLKVMSYINMFTNSVIFSAGATSGFGRYLRWSSGYYSCSLGHHRSNHLSYRTCWLQRCSICSDLLLCSSTTCSISSEVQLPRTCCRGEVLQATRSPTTWLHESFSWLHQDYDQLHNCSDWFTQGCVWNRLGCDNLHEAPARFHATSVNPTYPWH